MITNQSVLYLFGTILLLFSCKTSIPDGHYHLVWNNNNEQFQVWNIKDNTITFGGDDDVCGYEVNKFSSEIAIEGNKFAFTWVDSNVEYFFKIRKDGTIILYGERDSLWLVPHQNCMETKAYFEDKTRNFTTSFDLLCETMTGYAAFPKNYENELIIGGLPNTPFYLFNNKELIQTHDGYGMDKVNEQSVWIHIDKNICVKNILPIVKELYENGYKISYSSIQSRENDEQINLLNRNFIDFKITPSEIGISYCESCAKYPDMNPDSIVKIEILGNDSCLVNGKIEDFFQTRNYIARYIGQNRTTRLNTELQIGMNGNIPFGDYLMFLDYLNFARYEICCITYYRGKDDVDGPWILEMQESYNYKEILGDFPMKIKEIIKME